MKFLFKIACVLVAIWSITLSVIAFLWYSNEDYKKSGIVVLNYHQVSDQHYSALTMHPKDFRIQMEYLKTHGYHPITTKQLDEYMTAGKELPDKPVLITFDDGYEDNYIYAYPILKEYNFPATIYMIGDSFDQPRFLKTWQLKELMANGIEIESHTYHHIPLTKQQPDALRADLVLLRQTFLDKLGYNPKYIAYPQGFLRDDNLKVVQEAGYRMGFTVDPGFATVGSDLLRIHRTPIFEVPYRNQCFVFRLHFPKLVSMLWHVRIQLIKDGHKEIAHYIPTF